MIKQYKTSAFSIQHEEEQKQIVIAEEAKTAEEPKKEQPKQEQPKQVEKKEQPKEEQPKFVNKL
jgi:hypothetical protein